MSNPVAAHDTLVVFTSWGNSASSVASVTDASGTVFVAAGAIARGSSSSRGVSQAVYYAADVGAIASESITVTFSGSLGSPEVRVAEYSGLSLTSPFTGTIANAAGDGGTPSASITAPSGPLLLVLGATAYASYAGTCPGFDVRLNNDDDSMLGDAVVTGPGTFDAAPPMTSSDVWLAQIAAFH